MLAGDHQAVSRGCTALHYSLVKNSAVKDTVLKFSAKQCNLVYCSAMNSSKTQYDSVLYYSKVQYSTVAGVKEHPAEAGRIFPACCEASSLFPSQYYN